jgi:hypothetical protein
MIGIKNIIGKHTIIVYLHIYALYSQDLGITLIWAIVMGIPHIRE